MPPAAPDFSFIFRRPFAEQVAFFLGKLGNLVPTETWRDLMREAHDRAFMVAGAAKADLLADLAAAVEKAIAEGESLDAFRRRFAEIVDKRGWRGWTGEGTKAGTNWRTRVIYRTNIATSYAAGRLAQLKHFPLWVYRHSGAEHPRLQHKAWDGMVLPADHPFWQTHYPPNGWGCGCRVAGASSADAASRLGGNPDYDTPPAGWDARDEEGRMPGIDEGWDYMPGGTVSGDLRRAIDEKIAALPESLGRALRADEPLYTRPHRDAVRAIESAVATEQDKTIEYAALVRDGGLAWIKRGERSAVSFTPDEAAQFKGATLFHNHPSSRSLSEDDLKTALFGQLRRIYAIGADGSVYAAQVRSVSAEDLRSAYKIADENTYTLLSSWVDRGRIDAKDAQKYHHHVLNIVLARAGLIRYHAILANSAPEWVRKAVDIITG